MEHDDGPGPTNGAGASPTLLFDAECALCTKAVAGLDAGSETMSCVALDSDEGREVLASAGVTHVAEDSLLLVDEDGVHDRSTAVLRVAMRGANRWKRLRWLRVIPRPVRDALYRLVAQNRHRWPG